MINFGIIAQMFQWVDVYYALKNIQDINRLQEAAAVTQESSPAYHRPKEISSGSEGGPSGAGAGGVTS